MSGPRYLVLDGKRYLWRDVLRIRQEQRKAAKREQPTLFPIKEDCRPPTQKTARGRYEEPTLFEGT
ncbi:hypothetical protein [Methylocystis hirsuta]|uniref:Uncharacterized protein n=1 Tax=Methylocystis hirsuta TaxID=369798 RepID=A0A3M9XSU8_9HYPH|nr:hypothetical protein [Methylocystis hirsuta]RNJ51367.1 hypothetical protein D1O30_18980 [Methylocystis hirsuta]